MPMVTCPLPDQESSRDRSAWSARSYEGMEHPAKPSAARRSWPRWSSTVVLLDHLVRSQQHRLWDRQAERLRGLEVSNFVTCSTGIELPPSEEIGRAWLPVTAALGSLVGRR